MSEEFNTGFFLLAVKIELLVLVAVVFVVLLEANEPELTLILELELEFEFGFCQLEKKSSTLFSLEFDLEASESVSNGESASSWLFNTKADGYNSISFWTFLSRCSLYFLATGLVYFVLASIFAVFNSCLPLFFKKKSRALWFPPSLNLLRLLIVHLSNVEDFTKVI